MPQSPEQSKRPYLKRPILSKTKGKNKRMPSGKFLQVGMQEGLLTHTHRIPQINSIRHHISIYFRKNPIRGNGIFWIKEGLCGSHDFLQNADIMTLNTILRDMRSLVAFFLHSIVSLTIQQNLFSSVFSRDPIQDLGSYQLLSGVITPLIGVITSVKITHP